MATPLTTLVSDIRLLSGLMENQLYTDANIVSIVSDLWLELYDRFVTTNQHYRIKEFDFTLAGGVDGNTVELPSDFQLGNGLEMNPGQARPQSVKYLDNWLNRNNLGASLLGIAGGLVATDRQYCFTDNDIKVFPANSSAGDYRLYYTPQAETLYPEQTETWDIGDSASLLVGRSIDIIDGDSASASGNLWTIDNGRFVDAETTVGNTLSVSSPLNTGSFTIATIVSNTQITTVETPVTETLTGSDSASINDVLQYSFPNAEFTDDMVGGEITIAFGAGPPDNTGLNGTWEIFRVLSSTTVQILLNSIAASLSTPTEGDVTVNWQPPDTLSELPDYADPWAIYLKLGASIAIREARQQEVGDLERRFIAQKQRVDSVLQNRQEEPTQPPLTRGSSFWDSL